MNRIWIKLYLEILDDPKMGRLNNHLWRRAVELFLLAGRNGNDGVLPPVEEMAWALRSSNEDEVRKSLMSLAEIGVVQEAEPGKWVVVNFEKRQAALTVSERVSAYRERKRAGDVTKGYKEGNEDDNEVEVSISSSPSSLNLEGGVLGEGEIQIPETSREAAHHPDIQLFEEVSDQFPGARDYEQIIRAMQKLRAKHNGDLKEYLVPFWKEWSTRKTKDNKPYRKTNPAWLTEWAASGEIPSNGSESALTNGPAYRPYVHVEGPKKSAPPEETRKAVAALKAKMSNKKVLSK